MPTFRGPFVPLGEKPQVGSRPAVPVGAAMRTRDALSGMHGASSIEQGIPLALSSPFLKICKQVADSCMRDEAFPAKGLVLRIPRSILSPWLSFCAT